MFLRTAVCLLLLAACTRTIASSGAACALNSDCRAPLVCAATFCRPQCRLDRDCDPGESCVAYAGDGVCIPPAAALPCAFSSECGAGRLCVDGTCRATCASDADCAPGTCDSGRCTMPVTTPPDGGIVDVDAACPGCPPPND